jgi:hypothetical protein
MIGYEEFNFIEIQSVPQNEIPKKDLRGKRQNKGHFDF